MTPARAWIVGVASAVALLLATGWAANAFYFAPAAKLRTDLTKDRDAIRALEGAVEEARAQEAALAAIVATTLGTTEEQVDAALRDRLNAVAASAGLGGIQVQTSRPVPEKNPAGARLNKSSSRSPFTAGLSKQTDFWIVRGDVSGEGTLDQTLRALAALKEQPWAHRVESFSIKPLDKDRQRFELRAGVATMIMPDLVPEGFAPPAPVALSDEAQVMLEPIVARNVFKQPSEETRVATADPKPPPVKPPPPSPYLDWKLTGIVQVGAVTEAWLHNTKSNEKVALTAGGRVADAVLLTAADERAVFEIAGKKYEVFNGQTLDQRRPTEP
ncbi:MAG: hypothetical protein ACKVU4_01300 [Phycisphaerales bacterium]